MTIAENVISAHPGQRIALLEADALATRIKSDAGLMMQGIEHFTALIENHIFKRIFVGQIRKVLAANDPAEIQRFLDRQRADQLSGAKDMMTLMAAAASADGFINNQYDAATAEKSRFGKSTEKPTLLYVPGGGFILPPSQKQVKLIRLLAQECGCVPILGHHRLAPEDTFPAAPTDIADQICQLYDDGLAASSLFLAGDTAGASVVLGAVQLLRERQRPKPAGIILFSPWADLSLSGWSYITRSITPSSPFRMETAAFCAKLYLAGENATNPVASAIYASLEYFPPISIHTSKYDLHFDDAIKLAEKARDAKVSAHIHYWDTPRHHVERLNDKDAKKSRRIVADFIAQHYQSATL